MSCVQVPLRGGDQRWWRRTALASALAAAVVFGLAGPGDAWAAELAEPNDDIGSAAGPLAGDVVYTGSVGAADRVDRFFVIGGSEPKIEIRVTDVSPECGRGGLYVRDGFDDTTTTDWVYEGSGDETRVFSLNSSVLPSTRNLQPWSLVGLHWDGDRDKLGTCRVSYEFTLRSARGGFATDGTGVLPFSRQPSLTDGLNFNALRPFGPLAPNVAYEGAVDSRKLAFYSIIVQPGRLARLTLVPFGCSARFVYGTLSNPISLPSSWPREDVYVPGVVNERYFANLRVYNSQSEPLPFIFAVSSECLSGRHQVMVTPPESVSTDPAIAASRGPSRNTSPVIGSNPKGFPIAGGRVYERIKRDTQADTYRFRVDRAGEVRFSLMQGPTPCSTAERGGPQVVEANLLWPDGEPFRENQNRVRLGVYPEWVGEEVVRLARGEWKLSVSGGCAGTTYQLRVDPTGIVAGDGFVAEAQLLRVRTSITVKRRHARYTGRIRAATAVCRGGRTLKFSSARSGRQIGRARSRADGTFIWRKRSRVRGKLRIRVAQNTVGRVRCASATRTVRG